MLGRRKPKIPEELAVKQCRLDSDIRLPEGFKAPNLI